MQDFCSATMERRRKSPVTQPKVHILTKRLPHETVQLTHGSRGICSLPSSPGGSDQATPRQRDDHQGDGTPSPSGISTHKPHHMNWRITRSYTGTGYIYSSLWEHSRYNRLSLLPAEWFSILLLRKPQFREFHNNTDKETELSRSRTNAHLCLIRSFVCCDINLAC